MSNSKKTIPYSIEYYSTAKENQYLERKSARKQPKDIVKHIVAFANANGGNLVVGIEDDGVITGFRNPNSRSVDEFKNMALTELQVTPVLAKYEEVEVINNRGELDKILVISVEPSIDRIIKSGDSKVYLRQGCQSLTLKYDQIVQLEYDRGQRYFEDEIVEESSISDINKDIMQSYKQLMNVEGLTTEEVLDARNMIRNDRLTNAAILLFGKHPTKYLPQARMKFVKYDGSKAGVGQQINIVKEKTFDGPIPLIITEAKDFIQAQFRDFQYLDSNGIFKQMPEYPEFAWFEGIVNALTHRNYSVRGDYIKFIMFDDRVEIISPGLLPNVVTIENIRRQRYSRNPRIARILSEFGWVKEMNEGVKRIYNDMENFFLRDPVYSEPDNNVKLVLENNILNRYLRITESMKKKVEKLSFDNLNEVEKTLIHCAFMMKKITPSQAVEISGKSIVTARNMLKKLHKNGFLEWHGTSKNDPTQYYTFPEN